MRQMVRVTGIEPATSWSQTMRSTKLSYTLLNGGVDRCCLGYLRSDSAASLLFLFNPIKWSAMLVTILLGPERLQIYSLSRLLSGLMAEIFGQVSARNFCYLQGQGI